MMLPSSVHRTRPKLAHFTSVKSIQHSTAHGILTLRKPLHTFGEYLQLRAIRRPHRMQLVWLDQLTSECATSAR